jgi:hypothetical protein
MSYLLDSKGNRRLSIPKYLKAGIAYCPTCKLSYDDCYCLGIELPKYTKRSKKPNLEETESRMK